MAGNTTVRFVTAVLYCLAVVLFFQHTPNALRWPVRLSWVLTAAWLVFTVLRNVLVMRISVKSLVFSLILAALFYGALSLTCHVFNTLMSRRDDRLTTRSFTSLSEPCRTGIRDMLAGTSFNLFDKDVGWLPQPRFHSGFYTISAQGLRGGREYPLTPPDAEKRILCMGDSFTFGYAVGDQETYPRHAEQLRPGTEWINLGISGTCLTQSLLHYRNTGKKFGGKFVVIGFMTNDAQRTVNCFRPFVSPLDPGHPFTKPFAKFSNGRFSLEPNPYQDISDFDRLLADERTGIGRLRQLDYLTWSNQAATTHPILMTTAYAYESMRLDRNIDLLLNRTPVKVKEHRVQATADPYGHDIWNPGSPGFQAITRLFDLYHQEVIADGRKPLIVVIPGPLDVEEYTKALPRRYAALIGHFKARGFRHLDFLDNLVARHRNDLSRDALFVQFHYLGSVNKELAEEIIAALHLP